MVNIKVAVRIRPLTQRESLLGEDVIVRKENKFVLVTNPKIPERQDGDSRQRTRRFAVDFCYDPNDPEGCSQEMVYKEIGTEVLDSMFEGYNACVLAYGHSASGKTYTIMGMQNDPGLTPRLCGGLFEKLDEKLMHEKIRVQVIVSFLEIYNEKVRDLLGSEEATATGGNFSLRVREHPKSGPYVQGLSEHLVKDKRNLLEILATGNKRRSTAATENNTHSSRSHALFTIQFRQCDGENFEVEKSSKVHLVDLAGSWQEISPQETQTDERASSSQSKERLKEGANINKSLVTLGNVVSALAESCESGILSKAKSSSKSWHPFVPYRDSVLTWLLKDTLGGNSNTIMIATVSPASSCLNETVNTLRYAKRTKRIVNQPILNEDPKIRTIRQLRQEIERLKRLLVSFQSCETWNVVEGNILEETQSFSIPESKWLDSGGTKITNKEACWNENEKASGEEEEEDKGEGEGDGDGGGLNRIEKYLDGEKRIKLKDLESSSAIECTRGALEQGAALLKGSACEINDEKKSDVNGSVNDNFLHETQIFSDSLESFSSAFQKPENTWKGTHEDLGPIESDQNTCKICGISAGKSSLSLFQDFRSSENLSKKQVSEMLYRSRPDLIKGISSRSKEGPPSGSSQSCTDASNLSQSTSENSLNSSGSVDVSPLEKRPQGCAGKSLNSRKLERNKGEGGGKRKKEEKEALQSLQSHKKTVKEFDRTEIVEAVTSRLYVTKKNPARQGVAVKQEVEENEELEELKLCKRARMKLFDLSRKLAMTRKIKKTVDNDTQTDNMTATLRVKEKCVTTEPKGASNIEEISHLEGFSKEEKPCVVMNQVFIPRTSKYVVECGNAVRIEASETPNKHESATQTAFENQAHKNAYTSPIKFKLGEDDCFSEDSLDLEDDSRHREQMFTGKLKKVDFEQKDSFYWPPNSGVHFPSESEKRYREGSRAETAKSKETLFNGWPLTFSSENPIFEGEGSNILLLGACDTSSEESKKEENLSSENSFTSTNETDKSFSSETSSEDFIFYESSKEKDPSFQSKPRGDRELYTITESSEQSDLSDAFSPIQSQMSSLNALRCESEPQNPRGLRQERVHKTTKMRDWPSDARKTAAECDEMKRMCVKNKNAVEDSDRLFTTFKEASNSNKTKPENLQGSPTSVFMTEGSYESLDQVPRSAEGSGTRISFPESYRHRLATTKMDSKTINWTDFQSQSQKQYFNLNIPSSNISTGSAFSVDTHLFGKDSRQDRSADAIFSSADSITLVFMGPAKPKTSVLMEIIRRSLGKTFSSSQDTSFASGKSRSKGVQCDANLMRSVSVDSAMIALSRIAKNQEQGSSFKRSMSLKALSLNGTPTILHQKCPKLRDEENCYKKLKDDNIESERKKGAQSCDPASTNSVVKVANKKTEETEKTKKSVSWFGETKHKIKVNCEAPDFDLNIQNSPELEAEDSNEGNPSRLSPQRRVRFSKQGGQNHKEIDTEPDGSVDPLNAFLKEATLLLKHINFRSSKNLELSRKTNEELSAEENQMAEEKHSCSKNLGWATEKKKTNISLEKNMSWRSGADKLKSGNSTWPRMRTAAGRPLTGTKDGIPSHSDSLYLNGFFRRDRTEGSAESRNHSDLSRSFRYKEPFKCRWTEDSYSPILDVPVLNFDSISEIETEIEESCGRLEIAAVRDKIRERISNGLTKEGSCCKVKVVEAESQSRAVERKKEIKRQKAEKCIGICTCEALEVDPCKHLWSKDCRSNFELDSFGPGNTHCHQFCTFCRKKSAENYCSAVNLNSNCSFDFCRLNYYGFCPCSPVRLSHVASSPRAYMQRLLSLRRRIVNQTKRQ